jgi:FkbM family methyltransferase
VALVPFTHLKESLNKQGWCDVVPFYDIAEAYLDRHPLSNGWHSGVLSEQDLCGIESVLYRWDDDVSRAHHLEFVAWRSLREEWFFKDAPVTTQDRYFIPQVLSSLHDHEVFVDVGAHYGEASSRFLDEVKNQYAGIYAIEPDGDNLPRLRNILAGFMSTESEKIHLLTCALGSVAGEKRFYHGLGYASQFSGLGQADVEVKCLDDLMIPATFVKIHIEGWEGSAISGGLETIMQNRPILTVTSYHNRDGLWTLPAQIMSCLENYAFHFRLHSWQDGCSVIYAIPKERK